MHDELARRLRTDLAAAPYRAAAVTALLGSVADDARQRGVFAPARRALAGAHGALATLVRVFLLGEAVPDRDIETALPALGATGAQQLGLIVADGVAAEQPLDAFDGGGTPSTAWRAALSLNSVVVDADAEWWVLSDLDDQLRRGPARPDHVMGVGGATRSLLAQSPRATVDRALDLGTGCGIVALQLTRFASSVVATDISERALALARTNAVLNDVADQIEFRRGDLFAPVRDQKFDLVLSNPPFVITPRDADAPVYEYRDGGLTGDALAERVITQGPEHLEEGGTLLCLANWESPWGANGLGRVGDWIERAIRIAGPLAAWVLERDRVEPATYAETWVRDGGARPGDPAFERLLDDWLADFTARRITAIGLGSVRVRRRPATAESVVQLDSALGAFAAAPGNQLQRAFSVGAATAAADAATVLATRWVLDDAVVEEREHRPGEESPRRITLTTDQPIARRVAADALLAAAVGACDGELTLRQIADALATLLEVDAAAAADALVAGITELAWFGMVAPGNEAVPGGQAAPVD